MTRRIDRVGAAAAGARRHRPPHAARLLAGQRARFVSSLRARLAELAASAAVTGRPPRSADRAPGCRDAAAGARRKKPRSVSPRPWSRRPRRPGRAGMANVSPLVRKGAIMTLDPITGIPLGTIMLQYNPDTLTRSLKPQAVGEQPDRTRDPPPQGPADRDHQGRRRDRRHRPARTPPDPVAISLGIQPQLSALELLVYPASVDADRQRGAVTARHDRDPADGLGADRVRLERAAHHAGAHHRPGHHRGGVRPPAQPDPRQGVARACGC